MPVMPAMVMSESEFQPNNKRSPSHSISPSTLKRPRRDAQPACSLKISA